MKEIVIKAIFIYFCLSKKDMAEVQDIFFLSRVLT